MHSLLLCIVSLIAIIECNNKLVSIHNIYKYIYIYIYICMLCNCLLILLYLNNMENIVLGIYSTVIFYSITYIISLDAFDFTSRHKNITLVYQYRK